ncbi:MAG: hypothetical protein MUF64_14345 [Polyangiaceae bacterium]|jgi:hypothetical protein|nr:hypothetical protein [Polyangiaceae bacterium]
MVVIVSDIPLGCAVLVLSPPCEEAGWREYIAAIDQLQAQVSPKVRPVLLQVLRRGITTPPPLVRREMAALRGRIRGDAINAVVADDPSVRLMQTALDWLRRPHYESSTHARAEQACAWVEGALGRPLPRLAQLYHEATRG